MGALDQRPQVNDVAMGAGVLQQYAEGVGASRQLCRVPDNHLDVQGLGPGLYDGDGLGVAALRDDKGAGAILFVDALQQRHCLGGGCALVQHRGVGQLHAGQVHDHLLVVEQGFQPALGYFRLVGCVRRVPAGILQHVALDDGGGERVGVAHANA